MQSDNGGAGVTIGTLDGGALNRLAAHVEEHGIAIDVVVVACAGDCADVEAVVRGGYSPYRFEWEDGSTDPRRRVCPDGGATSYSVKVTDSGTTRKEFPIPPETATARVGSRVLRCGDAGAPPPPDHAAPPVNRCIQNPSFESNTLADNTSQTTTAFPGDAWSACREIYTYRGGPPGTNPSGNLPIASDGLSMVAVTAYQYDGIGQDMTCSADVGHPLSIRFDAQIDPSTAHAEATTLELWGGASACDTRERVWTSPILREQWTTYCVTVAPSQPVTSILFTPGPPVFGYNPGFVYIDHIVEVNSCP